MRDPEEIPLTVTQDEAARFRILHEGPSASLIPNPWDLGSARILAGLDFDALGLSAANRRRASKWSSLG